MPVGRQQLQEGRDAPSTDNSIKVPNRNGREPLFDRLKLTVGRQDVSFSSRGFIPDYMTETNPVMMPEASRTVLEVEGVYGRVGMMPPAGNLKRLQAGQQLDEGAGGAGSFCTVVAFGAKTNG